MLNRPARNPLSVALLAAIFTSPVLFGTPLRAATLVNDTFDVGAPTTAGDDAADPLDVSWTGSNGTTSVASDVGTPGLGSGNALAVSFFSTGGSTFAPFSRAALINVGDFIQLSFDFRFTTMPAASATGFRFALESTSPRGAYDFTVGTGGTLGGSLLYRNSSFFAGGTPFTTAGVPMSISDTAEHNATLRVTRATAGLLLQASVDGNPFSATDPAFNVLGFDRLQIGEGNIQHSLRIDNVVIEYVPEPSAGLLAFTAAGVLLARRPKRAATAAAGLL